MKRIVQSIALAAALAIAGVPMFASNGSVPQDLTEKVRHELVMIPYYSVFDDLNYRVDNGVVTLSGEVTQPIVKQDAERSVKHLAGVTQVIHIIVDNGHVTLVGVVDNQADKDTANIRANTVPGVFSVTNNLRVVEQN
jgi:hyperosmotically inducible protein